MVKSFVSLFIALWFTEYFGLTGYFGFTEYVVNEKKVVVMLRCLRDCAAMRRLFAPTLLLLVGWFTSPLAYAAPKAKLIEFWNVSDEQSGQQLDHSPWQNILNKYLDDNHASGVSRFDYANVSAQDMQLLRGYVNYLQSFDPRSLTRKHQFAYWVNLYNAKTAELVIDAVQKRGIRSIKQIRSNYIWPGPWSRKSLEILGKKLTLNDVEHGVLRPIWQDHRIHFVVNCASIGCPNLLNTAMTADNAESLLASSEEVFLNHSRAVERVGNQLVLSQIFKWYLSDFAGDEKGLIAYLAKHRDLGDTPDQLSIRYRYDWALNSVD